MRIVAFTGPKMCGKDTAAKALFNLNNPVVVPGQRSLFQKNPFAYGVKAICNLTFGWDFEQMDDPIFKETMLDEWPNCEPRWPMMDIANWMRDKYGGDVWVRAWINRVLPQFECQVITDLRFPEELEMLAQHQACIIYIHRTEAEEALAKAKAAGDEKALNPSEAHYPLMRQKANFVLENDGEPFELRNAVLQAVRQHFGYWGHWGTEHGN